MLNLLHPFTIDSANADSKNTAVSLRIGESIMVPEVSTDSINIELDPTAANGDFKTASVTVGVSTNRTAGYTLTASVEGSETALTNADYDNYEIAALGSKTSADDFADLSKTASMNKWGYATDNNGDGDGQTEAGYYYAMPDKDNPTTLKITDGPAATSNTEVTFATKGKDLAAGKYSNTVVFTAIGNLEPEPDPCTEGCTIHYDANGGTGSMSDQTTIDGTEDGFTTAIDDTNYTNVTLRAQNFYRTNYGFAGWNTAADGSGTTYGPMETVDLSELISNNEVTLYAKWIASAGNIQDFTTTTCNSMSIGDVTARKDSRDSNTYAIAKLADGKCWMAENLRLGSTSSLSITTSNSVTAGTVQASSSSWDTSSYTKVQQNSTNIAATGTARTTPNATYYGYGNYYSWAQAIMSTTEYKTQYQNVSTSLCPKSWRLPSGMLSSSNGGDFGLLSAALGLNQTTMNDTTTPTGAEASAIFRAYPNNFVYSGWYLSSAIRRGTNGYYWSSTMASSGAYRLNFHSIAVSPSTNSDYKFYGFAVRCLISS